MSIEGAVANGSKVEREKRREKNLRDRETPCREGFMRAWKQGEGEGEGGGRTARPQTQKKNGTRKRGGVNKSPATTVPQRHAHKGGARERGKLTCAFYAHAPGLPP